jgi:iron complex outermembrane receptor protein
MKPIKIRPMTGMLRRAFPIAAPLLLTVMTAHAQTVTNAAPAAATAQPIQRVEITGSNIRRAQAETASAVQTVNRADIEKSGKTTVAELLQTLAVDNQGSVPTTFGSGFAAGASGISLRGLGAASTLVLLNGRRIAPYGLADDGQKVFADLNIIPAEAVERVEILKDGASAIYGSDAIAGVVNVILRKDYVGTTVRLSQGLSNESDGGDTRLAVTHGVGDLETDKYNFLFSAEYGKKREVWNRDRADRGAVGRGDLRDFGFSAQEALGGTGAIVANNSAGSSVVGNVRNPVTNDYYSRGSTAAGNGFTRTFPGAACSNFTNHPQGAAEGGCLTDATQQYNQIQPRQETLNLFGRATFQLNNDWQAYVELNGYHSDTESWTTPSGISGSVGYPGGPVNNANVSLGATHPDNPYFGSAARLRYIAWDVGPRTSAIETNFTRAVAGIRGTAGGWDIDSALLYSQSKTSRSQNGYLQRDVAFALLNPNDAVNVASARANSAAYAALPAGSFWRIGENAGLNSQAVYDALSPTITNDATTSIAVADVKASREFGQLPGGAMGVAMGAEFRHDETELAPNSGTERGNIIGLGYSAYEGQRNSAALYAEFLAPVHSTLELSAALRYDHFNDVGNSYTPKAGFKWTPVNNFALRGTFARGFRAPSAAENGRGGLAAFSTSDDPVRCALKIPAACASSQVAVITSPNPDLSPEKSKSFSLGAVWDPLPRTSISLDAWQIERKNEINQETTSAAIAAGNVVRDPGSSQFAGDPGQIVAVLTNYINSNSTKVNGIDLDARTSYSMGDAGTLTANVTWTHMLKFERTDLEGNTVDYAGTHGNCDATNCMGTPDNRVNLGLGWERGPLRVNGVVNYRGKFDNTLFKDDPEGCAFHFSEAAGGGDAPNGCKISSFTTLDLTAKYRFTNKAELFATIQNVFDKEPPLDPLTYGAAGYNPLDYSGALGRYFQVGVRYTF